MAKELKDIKLFLEYARRKDVKSATVKKNGTSQTKFKIRGARYLYTLVVKDQEKAQKLIHSLPPGLATTEIKNKKPKKSSN